MQRGKRVSRELESRLQAFPFASHVEYLHCYYACGKK